MKIGGSISYVEYLLYYTQQQGEVLDRKDMKRKSSTPEFKLKVVLESMQRDTTQEEACKKFGIASSMLHRWRKEFEANAASVFHDKRDPNEISSCARLRARRIARRFEKDYRGTHGSGRNTKKSLGAGEEVKTAHKVELACLLCRPHGPYAKSQVARALGIARGMLYFKGKQAGKDKAVAVAIAQWHEQDDTMGHRKLAVLLKMGKNRVKRVMKKYGIAACRKKKHYVYPDKTNNLVPNRLRDEQTPSDAEIVFSEIIEVHLVLWIAWYGLPITLASPLRVGIRPCESGMETSERLCSSTEVILILSGAWRGLLTTLASPPLATIRRLKYGYWYRAGNQELE
jgi:transposase-like protein